MSDVVSCPSCGKYFDATFDVQSCAHCGASLSPAELQAARDKRVEPVASPALGINWLIVLGCIGLYLFPRTISIQWEYWRIGQVFDLFISGFFGVECRACRLSYIGTFALWIPAILV